MAKSSAIRRILVPTDFSPPSDSAVESAAMIAKRFGAGIVLSHVIESPPYIVTDTFMIIEQRRALQKTARFLLHTLRQKLHKKGVSTKVHLTGGVPHQEILKKSRRERVDMIVMGTHGRTGIKHLVMGSVAEKVVRLSTCPVLTVPLPSERRVKKSSKSAKKTR